MIYKIAQLSAKAWRVASPRVAKENKDKSGKQPQKEGQSNAREPRIRNEPFSTVGRVEI